VLCDDVFEHYERFGDVSKVTDAFPPLGEGAGRRGGGRGRGRRSGGRAPWTNEAVWHVFERECTGGGGGVCLSQKQLRKLYKYTKVVEQGTNATIKPFSDTFKTADRFIASVRCFKWALIAPLKLKKASMKIDGQVYNVCFRDALDAIRSEVVNTQYGDLYWGPDTNDDSVPDTVLRGAWDGEMYKEQHYHVQGTMRQGTRVLVLHLYSDSTILISSGAVSAYPLRMRIVININKEVRWVMLVYIPQVESKFLETRKGHEVSAELLQRILHLFFLTCMMASHREVWVQVPGGGSVRVSPRVLLYVCDKPEERAIMCLKGSECFFPCTPCMVERDNSCTAAGAAAPSLDVDATVKSQLSNAKMSTFWGAASRRAEVEMEHSLNSVAPALAAWAGLGNGPRMLYRFPGFDRLHVRSLALSFIVALPCVSPLRPSLLCASPHLAPLGVILSCLGIGHTVDNGSSHGAAPYLHCACFLDLACTLVHTRKRKHAGDGLGHQQKSGQQSTLVPPPSCRCERPHMV